MTQEDLDRHAHAVRTYLARHGTPVDTMLVWCYLWQYASPARYLLRFGHVFLANATGLEPERVREILDTFPPSVVKVSGPYGRRYSLHMVPSCLPK